MPISKSVINMENRIAATGLKLSRSLPFGCEYPVKHIAFW